MNKSNVIKTVVDEIHKHNVNDFNEALKSFGCPQDVVFSALFALGSESIDAKVIGDELKIVAKFSGKNDAVIIMDKVNLGLSGDLVSDVERAFNLAVCLETVLSVAMNYPFDMRQKRIESVCNDLGVSDGFYSMVLSNWKVFS